MIWCFSINPLCNSASVTIIYMYIPHHKHLEIIKLTNCWILSIFLYWAVNIHWTVCFLNLERNITHRKTVPCQISHMGKTVPCQISHWQNCTCRLYRVNKYMMGHNVLEQKIIMHTVHSHHTSCLMISRFRGLMFVQRVIFQGFLTSLSPAKLPGNDRHLG